MARPAQFREQLRFNFIHFLLADFAFRHGSAFSEKITRLPFRMFLASCEAFGASD